MMIQAAYVPPGPAMLATKLPHTSSSKTVRLRLVVHTVDTYIITVTKWHDQYCTCIIIMFA